MQGKTGLARVPEISKEAVLDYAREVFGDARKSFSWLTTPNQILDGMRPRDIIECGNYDDITRVFNELQRIDQGLF